MLLLCFLLNIEIDLYQNCDKQLSKLASKQNEMREIIHQTSWGFKQVPSLPHFQQQGTWFILLQRSNFNHRQSHKHLKQLVLTLSRGALYYLPNSLEKHMEILFLQEYSCISRLRIAEHKGTVCSAVSYWPLKSPLTQTTLR